MGTRGISAEPAQAGFAAGTHCQTVDWGLAESGWAQVFDDFTDPVSLPER